MMYNASLDYRIRLHNEVHGALEIIPHDNAWKNMLYKSLLSIPHTLDVDTAQRIRTEYFDEINTLLKCETITAQATDTLQ